MANDTPCSASSKPRSILRRPDSSPRYAPDLEPIYLMNSRNYKFNVSVGVSNSVLVPVIAVFDTGAGPNPIREDVVPPNWETLRLRGVPIPKVMNASGRLLNSKGLIFLIVQVGNLLTRLRFYVTAGISVPCILGCNFIDRHVKSILPGDRRVELNDDGSVAISENFPRSLDPPGTPRRRTRHHRQRSGSPRRSNCSALG
jgi:hypothetical protein